MHGVDACVRGVRRGDKGVAQNLKGPGEFGDEGGAAHHPKRMNKANTPHANEIPSLVTVVCTLSVQLYLSVSRPITLLFVFSLSFVFI